MAEPQSHSETTEPSPSVRLSAPRVRGEQREDVPYHWPRGQEAPSSPAERRLQQGLIFLVVLLSMSSLALLWYMIAKSTRAI